VRGALLQPDLRDGQGLHPAAAGEGARVRLHPNTHPHLHPNPHPTSVLSPSHPIPIPGVDIRRRDPHCPPPPHPSVLQAPHDGGRVPGPSLDQGERVGQGWWVLDPWEQDGGTATTPCPCPWQPLSRKQVANRSRSSINMKNFRKFNARRKWKLSYNMVSACNRLCRTGQLCGLRREDEELVSGQEPPRSPASAWAGAEDIWGGPAAQMEV
uniref:Uncharacterized protein n=1 Tax=Buteo japonicus TaxID=224669 RepID=A0A8C0BZ62_9AVES